jgi:uncharacterized membrane protein YkoI
MKDGRLKGGLLAAAVLAAAAGGGAAIAGATGGGDDNGGDVPIAGGQLQKASAVALQHTGGGRVTDSEIRDEEGYYEVEVTRSDGSQVDVHLDRQLNVLNAQADGNGSHDDGSQGD